MPPAHELRSGIALACYAPLCPRSQARGPNHSSLKPASRLRSRRSLSSRAGAPAFAERCPVIDYVLLCATTDELTQDDAYEAFSEILSLMYMVPNILIGFTGPVRWQSAAGAGDAAPFNHALHFRLADRASATAFMNNPEKIGAFKNYLDPVSQRYTEALFTGTIPKDMDSMFRRADRWAAGAEHLAFVANNPACPSEEPEFQLDEYTQLLTQVAESPVAGSIQSMAGPMVAQSGRMSEHAPAVNVADDANSHMIMSRFLSVEEAQAFSQLPPCDALRHGDNRCPGLSVQEIIFEIEPVQGSKNSSAV
eukprot:jgi/Ulvmu1/11768/UM008_0182.1